MSNRVSHVDTRGKVLATNLTCIAANGQIVKLDII